LALKPAPRRLEALRAAPAHEVDAAPTHHTSSPAATPDPAKTSGFGTPTTARYALLVTARPTVLSAVVPKRRYGLPAKL